MDKKIPARALIECILCANCNNYATATGGGICAACALTAERDQLRAEVDRLRERVEFWEATSKTVDRVRDEQFVKCMEIHDEHVRLIHAATARAEAAESLIAVLRGALEEVDHGA